jgi:hypothetical protein
MHFVLFLLHRNVLISSLSEGSGMIYSELCVLSLNSLANNLSPSLTSTIVILATKTLCDLCEIAFNEPACRRQAQRVILICENLRP